MIVRLIAANNKVDLMARLHAASPEFGKHKAAAESVHSAYLAVQQLQVIVQVIREGNKAWIVK